MDERHPSAHEETGVELNLSVVLVWPGNNENDNDSQVGFGEVIKGVLRFVNPSGSHKTLESELSIKEKLGDREAGSRIATVA